MRYVIYGAGGVGGGIGAQLAQGGHDVALIARGRHLDAIQEQGLLIKTPEGEATLSLPAVGHPSELDLRGEEVFLFTMKSQDSVSALDELRAVAGEDVPVIMAQNGVANERAARRRFRRAYGMLILLPAQFLEPGVVVLHGTPKRGTLHAGCFPRGVDDTIREVCANLEDCGFDSEPHREIMPLKYAKLLLNLNNAVEALVGLGVDTRDLARDLRREARLCFEAAGIDSWTPRQLVDHCRAGYDLGPVDGEERLGGSSWQGLMRGTGSIETDFLNGEIVLLGALHGVPTPLNEAVQRLAARAAREGSAPGDLDVDDIREAATIG